MSDKYLDDLIFDRKSVSSPFVISRAALIVLTTLTVALPSLRADTTAQTKLNAEVATIQPGKTIVSCSASTLATAVSDAIATGASTPLDYALSALEPYPAGTNKVRADRNTAAGLVTSAAIGALVTKGDVNFAADVSTIVDSVCKVNGTNPSENLVHRGNTGMGLVIRHAIGTISDKYLVATSSSAVSARTLLQTDQLIGQKLATDSTLEGLPDYNLVGLALHGMEGIIGNGGLAPAAAPLAAENFALGLVSNGTVPDAAHGMTFPLFAVYLLSQVEANHQVDELVAYSIASKDDTSSGPAHQSAVVSLGKALLGNYPGAEVKITQGLAGAIPQGNSSSGEASRVAFAGALTSVRSGAAVNILAGMVFVDPFYAAGSASRSGFTRGVFDAVLATSGFAGLNNIAGQAGVAVGNVLGQDSAVLSEEASTYADFIAAGNLRVVDAGNYAIALISGARNSNVSATEFTGAAAGAGGGRLYLGKTSTSTDMATAVVQALSSITDVLADGIIRKLGVTSINKSPGTAATYIGLLVADVTRFTTNETFTDTQDSKLSGSVGLFEAATLDDYIASLGLSTRAEETILNRITADAKNSITNATFRSELTIQETAAEHKNSVYTAITGALAGEETVCTNL